MSKRKVEAGTVAPACGIWERQGCHIVKLCDHNVSLPETVAVPSGIVVIMRIATSRGWYVYTLF